ncbi:MAG: hypothetical protein JWN08_3547 [Frankiales bacterium]|jgi:hypothetical protein|nr:hypothetical protein [Frankiales bacterium]
MTYLVIVLVLLCAYVLTDLLRLLRSDGLGHRPPPSSHPPYFSRLPS